MFARLQVEIGKHAGGCIEDKKSEKIVVINSTKKIGSAVEIANKPKSVMSDKYIMALCTHCLVARKEAAIQGGQVDGFTEKRVWNGRNGECKGCFVSVFAF